MQGAGGAARMEGIGPARRAAAPPIQSDATKDTLESHDQMRVQWKTGRQCPRLGVEGPFAP